MILKENVKMCQLIKWEMTVDDFYPTFRKVPVCKCIHFAHFFIIRVISHFRGHVMLPVTVLP